MPDAHTRQSPLAGRAGRDACPRRLFVDRRSHRPAAAVEDTAADADCRRGTAVTGATVLHAILPIDTGEGKPFADEVSRLSGGAVRVQLDSGWHATSLTAERDAIAAVKSGDVDLGIVPARAFHDAGVTAFDALVAPMTIDSLDLEVAVLKAPVGRGHAPRHWTAPD